MLGLVQKDNRTTDSIVPGLNQLRVILESLDVDDGAGDVVVPSLRLNDQRRELLFQGGHVVLEPLGVDQTLLEISGCGQTRLDLFSSLFNVVPETNQQTISNLNRIQPVCSKQICELEASVRVNIKLF